MEALAVLPFVILLGFAYYGAQWLKEKENNNAGMKIVIACALIIMLSVWMMDHERQKDLEFETSEAYREGYSYGYTVGYDDASEE